MKQYNYRAFDAKGVIQEDTIWAESSEEIVQKLQYKGWHIIEVAVIKSSEVFISYVFIIRSRYFYTSCYAISER